MFPCLVVVLMASLVGYYLATKYLNAYNQYLNAYSSRLQARNSPPAGPKTMHRSGDKSAAAFCLTATISVRAVASIE